MTCSIRSPRRLLLIALACGLPLWACAELPRRADAPSGMHATAMKANGSGVRVQYRIDAAPQTGQMTSVTLTFDGITSTAGALARVEAGNGLAVVGDATLPTLRPGEVATFTINVTPSASIAYLHVFTTQNGLNSVTSIPIQVGTTPAKLPESDNLKSAPDGEKIITMPVR